MTDLIQGQYACLVQRAILISYQDYMDRQEEYIDSQLIQLVT